MTAPFQMNMIAPSAIKGFVDKVFSAFTVGAMVDPASVNTLVPGDCVKLSTAAGTGVYLVDKAAATDLTFGVVVYEVKKNSYVACDSLSIALPGTIILGEAGAAITRGDSLEFVAAGSQVITNAGVNPVMGRALNSASGAGKLLAVLVGGVTLGAVVASRGSVVTALTPGATVAIDSSLGRVFTLTPAQAETINITGGVAGATFNLIVVTSGATSYTLTLGTGFGANGGTLATGIASGKTFVLKFVHNGTSFVEVSRTAAM